MVKNPPAKVGGAIQVFQETRKVVSYSHLFKNFPQFAMIHTDKGFSIVDEAEVDVFSGIPLLSLWSCDRM